MFAFTAYAFVECSLFGKRHFGTCRGMYIYIYIYLDIYLFIHFYTYILFVAVKTGVVSMYVLILRDVLFFMIIINLQAR